MRFLKVLCVAVLALSSAAAVFGQMIPTGQLVGTVTDTDKAPLPGVSVTISSPSLMLPQMAATTSENGSFRFFSLPSGTYKVVFELTGFRGVVREGIIVSASRTVSLDIALEQGGIEESVTVIGESPTVDLKQTQTGTTFTKDLIATLPLARDLASIFNSAPGMFARTSFGSDARSNNFVVDGVKMQDPVTGDPYQTVPWNAIDEVSIETGSQKAEYGAVKGALVNVITKAGGNTFSGGLNFYYRSKSLQSDNTKGTPFEGQFVGFRYQYLPGFSLGGPIVKDKVWFFTSFDYDKSSSYTQGFPAPATFGGAQPESAPIGQTTVAPFGKVTFQLSDRDKLVMSGYWRGYKWDHRGASRWTVLNANVTEDSAVTIATAQWTRTMSKDVLFNLKGSWYSLHQYLLANDSNSPLVDEATDNINRGGYGSDWWYTRRRAELTSDLTLYKDNWLGSHEFKLGADAEFSFDGTECQYYQDPHFEGVFPEGFKAVDIFLWDGVPNWAWVGTEYKQKNNLIQVGGFLQDTWSPAKRLTLNLGVRLDHSQGNYPPQKKRDSDEWVNEETIKAMSFTMFSPRAGATYALTADGKTVLKASFGRYYAPLLMIYYYFNNPNQRSSFMAQLNPDWSVNYTTPVQSPGTTAVDPDIKSPFADELSIGVERELFEDFSASATFIAKWEKNLIDDVDRVGDLHRQVGEEPDRRRRPGPPRLEPLCPDGRARLERLHGRPGDRPLHRGPGHLLRDERYLRGLRLRLPERPRHGPQVHGPRIQADQAPVQPLGHAVELRLVQRPRHPQHLPGPEHGLHRLLRRSQLHDQRLRPPRLPARAPRQGAGHLHGPPGHHRQRLLPVRQRRALHARHPQLRSRAGQPLPGRRFDLRRGTRQPAAAGPAPAGPAHREGVPGRPGRDRPPVRRLQRLQQQQGHQRGQRHQLRHVPRQPGHLRHHGPALLPAGSSLPVLITAPFWFPAIGRPAPRPGRRPGHV